MQLVFQTDGSFWPQIMPTAYAAPFSKVRGGGHIATV